MSTKKTVIGFSEIEFQQALNNDRTAFKVLGELNELLTASLGSIEDVDYTKFLDDPMNYIVEKYWGLHCTNRPQHLNKSNVFQNDTNVDLSQLDTKVRAFKSLCSKLGASKPIIKANNVLTGVKRDNYDIILNNEKKPLYDSLVKLIKAVQGVRQELPKANYLFHVKKFVGSEIEIDMANDTLRINPAAFR